MESLNRKRENVLLFTHLVATTCLTVNTGIMTGHNFHIVCSDGDTGGRIISGKATRQQNKTQNKYLLFQIK